MDSRPSFLVHAVPGEDDVGIDLARVLVDEFALGEEADPANVQLIGFIGPQVRNLPAHLFGQPCAAVNLDLEKVLVSLNPR